MFAAASSQLGPHWSESRTEVADPCWHLEAGRQTQIQSLDEEQGQLVAQILQARHVQVRKPVEVFRQQFMDSCVDPSDNQRKPKMQDSCGTVLLRVLSQRLPIIAWTRSLTCSTFRADLIAGVTVGVMAIPQSMSYAKIAGLPYVFGMYSACVPPIVYAIFGQSRQLAVGPVAMVSLLVEAGLRGKLSEKECPAWYARGAGDVAKQQYDYCPEEYTQLAILTALLVGAVQIIACILRLGFIVSFLGHPVISGFTSGAAIIIGLSQVKYIFGFDVPKSEVVYETVYNTAANLQDTQFMTLFLGLLWILCLFLNKKVAAKYKRLSLLGALGPLASCIIGILLVWLCKPLRDQFNVAYVGKIESGLFPASIGKWNFGDIPRALPTALTASVIGYMESIAISKNLAAKHGYEVEPGQELLALGMSNLVGAMFSCYPVTGSFSRSAVNNSTGALSQLSGLVTGLVMLCTLGLLTPLFFYLPKYVLAAIVINSVIALVAFGEASKLWRVRKLDFMLWTVAFIGTLFLGVLWGISVAVALSLCIVIYESVRPQITILWRIPGTTIYRNVKQETNGCFVPNVFIARIGSSMYFANTAFIKDMLLTYIADLAEANSTEYVVLEMTPVVSVDTAAIHALQDIVHHFRNQNVQVAFAMVGNRVEGTMRRAHLLEFVGEQWFFQTVDGAVQYCLRHQRAKKAQSTSSPQISEVEMPVSSDVHQRNKVSFSNDFHDEYTAAWINRLHKTGDGSGFVGNVLSKFQHTGVLVVRMHVESSKDGVEKHSYLVKDASSAGKLNNAMLEQLQQVLSSLLDEYYCDAEPQKPLRLEL
jgi:sulfate transporter 4